MRLPSRIAVITMFVPLALVLLAPGGRTSATAMPSWLARVEAVTGKASWRSPLADREWFRQQHGGREWVPVKRSDSYGPEIKLRTGAGGTLTLRLADGSSLKLLHDTEIELATLRDETQQGVSRVRLDRGAVEAIAGQSAAAENAFVIESRAGAVIVGTTGSCIRHRKAESTPAPCDARVTGTTTMPPGYPLPVAGIAALPPPLDPDAVTGITYLGCFKDTSDFDLNGHLERSAHNTPQRCVAICQQKGFYFAGVQYGESCLCGNSYGRYGPADNCDYPCTGDGSQVCGGYNANGVYATTGNPAPQEDVRCPPGTIGLLGACSDPGGRDYETQGRP